MKHGAVISYFGHDLKLLHTGVGMVNTAIHLTYEITEDRPDLVINFGIAGSFDKAISIGSVIEVGEDAFSEMGAEDGKSKLSLKEMGLELMQTNKGPVYNRVQNPMNFPSPAAVPSVSGITVNRVHGDDRSIREVHAAWSPTVETMEAAAVFQTCMTFGVPFRCFRGISNHVEKRNRARWQIGRASENVQRFLIDWIKGI